MLEELLKELKETWGYETEELNDIREKLKEVAHAAFWEGYNERSEEFRSTEFTYGESYGHKSDNE